MPKKPKTKTATKNFPFWVYFFLAIFAFLTLVTFIVAIMKNPKLARKGMSKTEPVAASEKKAYFDRVITAATEQKDNPESQFNRDEDWSMYSNEYFAIEYPSSFGFELKQVTGVLPKGEVQDQTKSHVWISYDFEYDFIGASVRVTEQKFEDVVKFEENPIAKDDSILTVTKTPVTFQGIEAVELYIEHPNYKENKRVLVVPYKNMTYVLSSTSIDELSVTDLIISSFKFKE